MLYALALVPVSLLPVALRMAGLGYALAALVLGLAFFGFSVKSAFGKGRGDARALFLASIVYLPLLLAAMMLDRTGIVP